MKLRALPPFTTLLVRTMNSVYRWIGLGLLVQFRLRDHYIITSPVLAITIEQASGSVVH